MGDIDEGKGEIAVCLRGLSEDYPFRDGSPRATRDEAAGARCEYEGDSADGERRGVELTFVDGSAPVD